MELISTTSTEERAHMRMSASDTCKRTILFRVSIVAKGQIKEESLLCNVESWESLSLADTADLVSRRFFGCSDHCERAILSTVSISQRVKSMKSVSFAILRKLEFGRHLRPCVGKSFSCWCCCVTASTNPVATRNHVAEHWTKNICPNSNSCQCC